MVKVTGLKVEEWENANYCDFLQQSFFTPLSCHPST